MNWSFIKTSNFISGLRTMVCRTEPAMRLVCLMLTFGWGAVLLAQEAVLATPAPNPEPQAADVQEETPSIEFLEFLGEWETDEGEWIAPEELADDEFAQLLEAAFETGPEDSD
jgi:hypothetical protein